MKLATSPFLAGVGVVALAWPRGVQAQATAPTPPTTEPKITQSATETPNDPAASPGDVPQADTPEDVARETSSEPVAEPPLNEPEPEPPMTEEPAPERSAPKEGPEPMGPETAGPTSDSYLDPQFNVGVGLRSAYTANVDQPDHAITTNVRPYLNGQVSEHIKFEANFESDLAVVTHDSGNTETVATLRILDAVIKLELDDLVNFWVGRFLPPSDRSNLSGPYFLNSWNYPVQSNLFPAIHSGRHDGVAYWGQVKKGMFKWQLGMFDVTGTDHNPLFTGRLVLNLLDPEGGYYNSSTYYGTKDVLAIGGTAQYQKGGTPGTGIDGLAAEVDVLFEKPIQQGAAGTFTAEAAYYNFKDVDQGQSVVGNLSYLLPGKQGVGTIQPQARLQYMFPDTGDSYPTIDAAINYIVDGHNCRFTLNYQHIGKHDAAPANNLITLGGQIQMF